MDFRISDWISGFHSGFLDFWISIWISGFQFEFLYFSLDFWISGFQFGFLPTVYEISFVTDPSFNRGLNTFTSFHAPSRDTCGWSVHCACVV